MSSSGGVFDRAYDACERLARAHYENFPVASRLLPAPMRPHISAVYAFARIGDDIADEGTDSAAVRAEKLQRWQDRLHGAVASMATPADSDRDDQLIICAVAQTIRQHALPISLFDDLISAFTQDITTHRYGSWRDLLDYCRRSANPVGRLVLLIAGHRDEKTEASADALCTALQLTNFWQDFGRDWQAGRLYVPKEVADACGATEAEISLTALPPSWVQAIDVCVSTTEAQFSSGRNVCDRVHGRLRYELRATWLGGRRILDRVRAAGAQLPTARPSLTRRDLAPLVWQTVRWGAAA